MSLILIVQGWFYIVTGLWPVLHLKSFEKVTGEKQDKWLVKTVGILILCSGIIFITYPHIEAIMLLAILNALSLAAIDCYYVYRGTIRRIYLLDAFVEVIFVLLLIS